MSYNGSGTFQLVAGNPVVTGTVISSTAMNNTLSDIATGLSTAVTKDGQTTPTANIPMGGFKLTGLGAATTNGDALRYENIASISSSIGTSIQSQTYVSYTTGGSSTAYTLTPTPAITAYAAGQSFWVIFHTASGAAPTLAISGVATPPNLVRETATGTLANIAASEIPAGSYQVVGVSATQYKVIGLPIKSLGDGSTAVTQASSDNSTKVATTAWSKVGLTTSLGTPGYIKFPTWLGGLIVQWGTAATAASTSVVVNYPTAFSAAAFITMASQRTGASTANIASTDTGSTTQFTIFSSPSSTATFAWLAIGS